MRFGSFGTVAISSILKDKRANCLRLSFLMAGGVEGIRRALVLGLVLLAGTSNEQAPSVGP